MDGLAQEAFNQLVQTCVAELQTRSREQQFVLGAVRREVSECRTEVMALRECLIQARLLSQERFSIQMHRSSFNAQRVAHGLSLDTCLDDIFHVREISFAVGVHAGPTAFGAALATSKKIGETTHDTLHWVREQSPCNIYVCGGKGSSATFSLKSVDRFNPKDMSWASLPAMTIGRHSAAAGVVASKLYVCGGQDGLQQVSKSVERFDPAVGSWEAMPEMLSARKDASAGVVASKLYICGGMSRHVLSSAERFNPAFRSWEALPPMQECRGLSVSGVVAGVLYVCSGYDGHGYLRTAESLCPTAEVASNMWENVSPMCERRSGAAAAAIGGRLYVCGGFADNQFMNSVEQFDPEARQWEVLPPMLMRRGFAAAAVSAGCLYIFGGMDDRNRLSSGERFDPVGQKWAPLPAMAERRSSAVAITASW